MTVRVIPGPARVEKLEVSVARFLRELLSPTEKTTLTALKREADLLSPADILTKAQSADTRDQAISGLVLLYEELQTLTVVDLLSPEMQTALDIFTALGVFGVDPATIAARIAAIKANETP